MYSIRLKRDTYFHPDHINQYPSIALVANARGIPSIITCKNKLAETHIYDASNWIHSNLNRRLKPNIAPNLIDALSATSAFFAPFADDKMRPIVDGRLYRTSRLMFWFSRWKRENPFRIRDLAPQLVLDNQQTTVRTGDGCLWDTRSLATSLWAIQRDNKHYNTRPIVFVLATEIFNIREWWSKERKHYDVFPEPSLFDGNIDDHRERTIEFENGFCYVYTRCVIKKSSCALPKWISQSMTVDVIVIVVLANTLNSLPFNKYKKWKLFENGLSQTFLNIFDNLHLHNFVKKRTFSIAISGGGARTAILGASFLRFIESYKYTPSNVSATSGGAWGIALHVMGVKSIHAHITSNLIRIHKLTGKQQYLLAAIRYINGSENFETISYTLLALADMNYSWKKLVSILLFGESHPPNWNIFDKVPWRVSFPFSILANSHSN